LVVHQQQWTQRAAGHSGSACGSCLVANQQQQQQQQQLARFKLSLAVAVMLGC
jgi:hypothetical protein